MGRVSVLVSYKQGDRNKEPPLNEFLVMIPMRIQHKRGIFSRHSL